MANKLALKQVRKALIDQYNIAKGSFDEEVSTAKEKEKAAKLAYTNAQATGDPNVIQSAEAAYTAAKQAVKDAKQTRSNGLSKISTAIKNPQTYANEHATVDTAAMKDFGFSDSDTKKATNESKGYKSNSTSSSIPLSASFYRDISASLRNKSKGNLFDAQKAQNKAQGYNQQNESANRQMEAQSSQQIANRNEFAEAGKVASMQNDAQNRQNIANREGLSGSSAALMRTTNAPDVQQQMNRQDTQRNVANQQREKADVAQQGATESFGMADQLSIRSRDFDDSLDNENSLTMGEDAGIDSTTDTDTDTDTDTNADTDSNTNTGTDTNTGTNTNIGTDTNAGTVPPTNTNVPTDKDTPPTDQPNSGAAFQLPDTVLIADEKGRGKIVPASEADAQNAGLPPIKKPENWNIYTPEERENYIKGLGYIKNDAGRYEYVGKDGIKQREKAAAEKKIQDINNSKGWWLEEQPDPPSDARVKNIKECLSDARMKWIKEDWDANGRVDPEDWEFLLKRIGKLNHNGKDYDPYNEDDWTDDTDQSVLNAYADHIRNYLYTYKPEATQVDSSIDPGEEHIGPMAQDIEKVNPACVKETPEGVKTVDTARLAMMNAGAIGDLARQLQELTDKFKALGGIRWTLN
jgi:hypothetical protein